MPRAKRWIDPGKVPCQFCFIIESVERSYGYGMAYVARGESDTTEEHDHLTLIGRPHGEMPRPVKHCELTLMSDRTWRESRCPAIGSVRVRAEQLDASAFVPPDSLRSLAEAACAGRFRAVSLSVQGLRYGNGRLMRISLSTEIEGEDVGEGRRVST
jgi:hypothetical protein